MISNIKSPKIIKDVFSLLRYHRCLKIMNYNKKIQSIFSVDLNTYKKEARLLRIFDKDTGIVKLYTNGTDNLIFEAKITKGEKEFFGRI